MIAFAHEYRDEQPSPAWHDGLLAILPLIREHLRFGFRKLSPDERAEALSEAIAHVTVEYAKLYEQGKQAVAFPATLADFAIRQYFAGRRVGSSLNINDVTSRYCQRQRGFALRSLDHRDPTGAWKETLIEDRRSTPAAIAASRLDLESWFDQLPRLKRGVAETLATGESTKTTAEMFDLSPGRISQIRGELADSWAEFQGEAVAFA